MSAEADKRRVGAAAADRVAEERARAGGELVLGLGTGSTAVCFVEALAGRRLNLRCVATSAATADLGRKLGLEVLDIDEAPKVDLVIDGADEIDPELQLIKGGGGALLREKLVWEAAARRIVIADASKQVSQLGRFPLPVEIIAFAQARTAARVTEVLRRHGLRASPQLRAREGRAVLTDGGNLILDVACEAIRDPWALGRDLKLLTGVVEHGLFLGLADEALIGANGTVQTLQRSPKAPRSEAGGDATAEWGTR